MSNPNAYRIPHRINDPMMIFAWPAPQVMPMMMLLGASLLIGHFYVFLIISLIWYVLYGYVSIRFPRGVIFHFLWWHGFTTGFTKETSSCPDPMKREFLE